MAEFKKASRNFLKEREISYGQSVHSLIVSPFRDVYLDKREHDGLSCNLKHGYGHYESGILAAVELDLDAAMRGRRDKR
jgi:hypothetical protein